MATDILTTLEFDRVRENLQRHCQFSLTVERAGDLGPSSDPATVRYLLDVTTEAYSLSEEYPAFSVRGARDIRRHLRRAQLGGMLQPTDLLEVLDTIVAARTTRRTFLRIEDAAERFPAIDEFVGFIIELPSVEADLQRSISERGDVLDSASDKLRTIRHEMRSAHARLVERINRYIQSSQYSTAIQDPIVTQRDGRYVIPVRADRRGQVPGVVHDTSASGQTVFLEPMEVVALNNRWRELQSAERHEIERILTILSNRIGDEADVLDRTLEALSAIDLALAKARYASGIRASRPLIVDEASEFGRRIALRRARHPLLDQTTVVPIDLILGDDFRVLVITGPNTGGKTVALKTVGLMTLMAQSGLFIPADEGSELCVFDGIFADIGDEQSIEQSLSTFSSHMVRVIAMLRDVSSESLVLLDEMGAGTDPEEGAALARALIEDLLAKNCLAIATTHYSDLKAFAYATPGAENGSVEFDLETLSPTYRLVVGVPGQSNALAIAKRLGMPERVIERARSYLNPEVERVDSILGEIRQRRHEAEAARREAERARAEAERLRATALQELAEAEAIRETARQDTIIEVERELAEARQALRRVRETPERLPREQLQPTIQESRTELEQATQEVRKFVRKRRPATTSTVQLRVGDMVEITSLGGEGEVLGFSDDRTEADIQMGAFKVRQPIAMLKRIGGPRKVTQPRYVAPPPRRDVDLELHLRGQRAAGVDHLVDDYLNDAYLSRLPYVRIVHGKGTGALREVVRQVIAKHPLVERWETPAPNDGGDGVTVVYLRES
ncbi:MAG TPA: endonuclease MutS2 [Thermomicrobiales bacterium]|nr:endonuclease MutS2 [Thermomicrobiales bacterium]